VRGLFETYPPAKRDRTIYKYVGSAIFLDIVAQVLGSVFHRAAIVPIICLVFIATGLLIAGPIIKWRRWSKDPDFQAFLAQKRRRSRGSG